MGHTEGVAKNNKAEGKGTRRKSSSREIGLDTETVACDIGYLPFS